MEHQNILFIYRHFFAFITFGNHAILFSNFNDFYW